MNEILTLFFLSGACTVAAVGLILVIRFWLGNKKVQKIWENLDTTPILDLETTKFIEIMPLIDWQTKNDQLIGEAGLSYLIRTESASILFDTGANRQETHPSPILHNMQFLGVTNDDFNAVFISHCRADHIGGKRWQRRHSFSLSNHHTELENKTCYAPEQLEYPGVTCIDSKMPTKISKGVTSLGSLPSQLFLGGRTNEQVLAINLENKGIVLFIGGGYFDLVKLIAYAQAKLDIPICGIIGSLHYPITESRWAPVGFNFDRFFNGPHYPWQPPTFNKAQADLALLKSLNLDFIYLSTHDTCDQTIDAFKQNFSHKFAQIKVGRPIFMGKMSNAYPIIFVHGILDWQPSNIKGFAYWGGKDPILKKLKKARTETHACEIGPISSNWDRACELFAYIKGGTVDYGQAHAIKHNHARFGRTYPGVYENWGESLNKDEINKIHLVAHDMGGQTARVLSHLLANGSDEEKETTPPDELSPLFKGNAFWIHSITTIASPHDGTTLADGTISLLPYIHTLAKEIPLKMGVQKQDIDLIDFKLNQWGLRRRPEETFDDYTHRLEKSTIWEFKDLSFWDLSTTGAREINQKYPTQRDIYYFSWGADATFRLWPLKREVPSPRMNSFLWKSALKLGKYKRNKNSDIKIDHTWFKNDGIVNTRSMPGPTNGVKDVIVPFHGWPFKGRWNFMGHLEAIDHFNITGIPSKKEAHDLYQTIVQMLTNLPE